MSEWATIPRGRGRRGEHISVALKGSVNLPPQALDALGRPTHMEILTNGSRDTFALRAASPDDANAYAITRSPRDEYGRVSARALRRALGITRSVRFTWRQDGDLVVATMRSDESGGQP